jgi:hypothetical protein
MTDVPQQTDAQARQMAVSNLTDLFGRLGRAAQSGGTENPLGGLGNLGEQFTQFLEMPIDLTNIFVNMGTQMAELVVSSLEQAGVVLVKGLTP